MLDRMLQLVGGFFTGIVWMVAGLGAAALLTGALSVLGFRIMIFGGPVVALLVMLLMARAARVSQRRRGRSVLMHVAQAVRLNLPLPPMLHAAAAGSSTWTGERMQALAALLARGVSLGEALRHAVPEIPPAQVVRIAAAERIGRLAQVLPSITAQARRRDAGEGLESRLATSYGLVVGTAMALLLALLGIIIVPKFHRIFQDFDTELPWLTRMVFTVSQVYSLPLLLAAATMAAGLAGWSLRAIFRGPLDIGGVMSPLVDPLLWRLPVAGGVQRDRGLAQAWELTAEAMRAGLPLPEAVEQAATLRINAVLRSRLLQWSMAMRNGEPVDRAAAAAGLPGVDRGLIATAATTGDMINTLSFLARYHDQRFSRVAAVLAAAGMPLVVIVLALLVGTIVVAFFLPLTNLIQSVSHSAL